MDQSNLLITVDVESPLPINVQIKEQIKWLVGKDLLRPGETLPSTNELADQLSINRNTIQWVYSQLKEEGLLVIQKGRGTQVADETKIAEFKKQTRYLEFVERCIKEAYELGYPAEDMLLSGFAFVQLFGKPLKRKPRYLFFECKVSSCFFYLDEIKRATAAEIETVDISAPDDVRDEAIRKADVIVTTLDMADVVKGFADTANKKVITVGSANDVSLLLNMLKR